MLCPPEYKKPSDMTGFEEVEIYEVSVDWGYGEASKCYYVEEEEIKRDGLDGNPTVKVTGYVKTTKVNAVHIDGDFRIRSITL